MTLSFQSSRVWTENDIPQFWFTNKYHKDNKIYLFYSLRATRASLQSFRSSDVWINITTTVFVDCLSLIGSAKDMPI